MLLIDTDKVTYLGGDILRRYLTDFLGKPCAQSFINKKTTKYYQLAIDGQAINQLKRRVRLIKNPNWSYKLAKNLIIMVGSNNILRGNNYPGMKHGLKYLLKYIFDLGVEHIYICTIPPLLRIRRIVFGITYSQKCVIEDYNNFIRSLSSDNITVVDVFPHLCKAELFEADGVHPNIEGFKVLQSLLPQIEDP